MQGGFIGSANAAACAASRARWAGGRAGGRELRNMGLAVRFGPQRLQLHSFQVGPRYTADGQLIKHTVLGNPAECVPSIL